MKHDTESSEQVIMEWIEVTMKCDEEWTYSTNHISKKDVKVGY